MVYNIDIDDYIGYGFSKRFVKSELGKMRGKHVDVRVNSPGGSLDHALSIRQQFIDHGDVTCYLYGFVASAATVLTLGAKKVCMSKYAFYLIHKVSNWVDAWGQMNADQIQKLIDDLKANKLENDKIDLVLAAMYAKKSGKEINDILPILKEGRWLSAKEALELGFVDEILDDGEKVNFTPEMKEKFNRLELPVDLPQLSDEHQNEEQQKFNEENFFNRLAAFFGKKKKTAEDPTKEIKDPEIKDDKTQKTEIMNKNFLKVNSVLQIEGIEFTDGKCTLTEDQIKAINAKLDSLETTVAQNDGKITDLTTQVENLKKNDGADTHDIKGEEVDTTSNLANTLFNAFKDFV